MTRKLVALFAVLCLVAWVGYAGEGHGKKMDAAAHAAKLKAELNLNADQTTKVQSIFADFNEKMEPVHAKAQAAREQLKSLKSANPPDNPAIKAKESELDSIKAQKQSLAADRDAALKKVLTPEQFTKYQELAASHMKKGEGHGEHPR